MQNIGMIKTLSFQTINMLFFCTKNISKKYYLIGNV